MAGRTLRIVETKPTTIWRPAITPTNQATTIEQQNKKRVIQLQFVTLKFEGLHASLTKNSILYGVLGTFKTLDVSLNRTTTVVCVEIEQKRWATVSLGQLALVFLRKKEKKGVKMARYRIKTHLRYSYNLITIICKGS